MRMGGLWLRQAATTSAAAFLGSCQASRELSTRLLVQNKKLPTPVLVPTSPMFVESPCTLISIPGEENALSAIDKFWLVTARTVILITRLVSLNVYYRGSWMTHCSPPLKTQAVFETRHVSTQSRQFMLQHGYGPFQTLS